MGLKVFHKIFFVFNLNVNSYYVICCLKLEGECCWDVSAVLGGEGENDHPCIVTCQDWSKVDGSWMVTFSNHPTSPRIWARWLAIANRGHSYFPLDFQTVCEYLISYVWSKWRVSCLLSSHIGPSIFFPKQLSIEWLSYYVHTYQSLSNTCLFYICSWSHTKSYTTQI